MTETARWIALSGKQYAGKDTVADLLAKLLPHYQKRPIARAIKEEFARLYHLSPQEVEANKAVYRLGLITVGQRRRAQNPNYWLDRILQAPGPAIVSDMRLQYEFERLKSAGAVMIRVESDRVFRGERGTLTNEADPTECELDHETRWDAVIRNDGSLEDLESTLRSVLVSLGLLPNPLS